VDGTLRLATTLRYADYQPAAREAEPVGKAFDAGTKVGTELSDNQRHSGTLNLCASTEPGLSA
jgi:hypothetical protein